MWGTAHSFLLIATCLSTAGCGSSWFSDRQTNPVMEEYQGTRFGGTDRLVGILATTASRRTILVNLDERDPGLMGFVCAEPPPDVSEAFARSLAAELSSQAPSAGGVGTVSGDARFASAMGTAVGTLLYRTQSLQFLRDQTYILCLDYLNGVIKSDSEYMERQRYLVGEFKDLLKEEFKHMPTVTVTLATTVPSPAQPSPYVGERQQPAAASIGGAQDRRRDGATQSVGRLITPVSPAAPPGLQEPGSNSNHADSGTLIAA